MKKFYTVEEAEILGDAVGADWGTISLSEFHLGINIERENLAKPDEVDEKEVAANVVERLQEFPTYYSEYE